MKSAEIITIGDEILIGQVINTNAAWIGEQLSCIGVSVIQHTTIPDEHRAIIKALQTASDNADLIIITGGLGPTKDDITKTALCEFFQKKLVLNDEVAKHVEKIFSRYGTQLLSVNKKQAEVPEGCRVLKNNHGTAPGMLFEENNKVYISLPGVPYEMKGIMEEEALPLISEKFNLETIVHRTILTQGIGESFLAEKIKGWANGLEKESIGLAYLPSPGLVRLRLTAKGLDRPNLEKKVSVAVDALRPLLPKHIFGEGNTTMAEVLGKLLREKGLSLSVAESCTGGNIAQKLTSIPGSSDYFKGGVVSYSNEIKVGLLGVDAALIEKRGAVSEAVAIEMAKGARDHLKSDLAISTTGVAGPTGGTEEKPVGTVWIGLATTKGIWAKKFQLGDNRERNIEVTALTALNLLRLELVNNNL
jgi:nicotinamide-nucleotide amidase